MTFDQLDKNVLRKVGWLSFYLIQPLGKFYSKKLSFKVMLENEESYSLLMFDIVIPFWAWLSNMARISLSISGCSSRTVI